MFWGGNMMFSERKGLIVGSVKAVLGGEKQ